ncbi:ankyrin repeats [bacterium BMS3Bbin10]|nr:ankyrin repeats [bacterium BMS3Bbin10]
MAEDHRYFIRSPDGSRIFGLARYEAAKVAALDYGEGALVVDTLAQAYFPMLNEVTGGEFVYAGFGGWDTGRFGLDRDLIEGIKKGHVAIVQAFHAKGADVNARDPLGGPALHWAVGGGRKEIVEFLLAQGADVAAKDHNGKTALEVARDRGRAAIAEILEKAGA